MKKILLLALMFGFLVSASAQRTTTMALAAGDTIVNTGTATKVLPLITAGYSGIVVQVNLVKISGTGAGTVQMQGSLDGVTYTNIGSAFTITNVATQSAYFNIVGPLPVYLQVLSTGAGTEAVKQTIQYVLRKYDRTN